MDVTPSLEGACPLSEAMCDEKQIAAILAIHTVY